MSDLDDAFEADAETVRKAMAVLQSTLKAAGLWEGKDGEEGHIQVRAYARSGYPLEMDSFYAFST